MLRCIVALVIAVLLPGPVDAQADAPFIFVKPTAENGKSGEGLAWWLHDYTARPRSTALFGKPVASIKDGWCKADIITRSAFISEDTKTQTDLDETFFKDAPSFEAKSYFGYPAALIATVGVYETCTGSQGDFIVLRKAADNSIVFVDIFDLTAFQAVIPDKAGLRYGDCWDCGFEQILTYDSVHKRFYWYTQPEGSDD